MDYRVEWSPEAIEDLETIADYIGRDSAFYARGVRGRIVALARSLSDFPRAGRVVPELGEENIRECFAYSYRLIYRIEPERILIVAVIHGRRLLASLGDRFSEPL